MQELKAGTGLAERLDIVTLQDKSVGQVVEVYTTAHSRVYKIRKLGSDEITYFDETKVWLKRRHFRNVLNKFFVVLS